MEKQFKKAKYEAYYSGKMSEKEYEKYSVEVGNKIYFNSGLNKLKKHYSAEQITELILTYLACNGMENEEFSTSKIISESLTKFPQANFERFGDRNYITKEIKRTYFDNSGCPIDVQADSISNTYGVEITVQDIVDFVCQYPKREFLTKADEERNTLVQITFEQTGFKLSGKFVAIYQRTFLQTAERISEEVPF